MAWPLQPAFLQLIGDGLVVAPSPASEVMCCSRCCLLVIPSTMDASQVEWVQLSVCAEESSTHRYTRMPGISSSWCWGCGCDHQTLLASERKRVWSTGYVLIGDIEHVAEFQSLGSINAENSQIDAEVTVHTDWLWIQVQHTIYLQPWTSGSLQCFKMLTVRPKSRAVDCGARHNDS